MLVLYNKMCGLAQVARTFGKAQAVVQAIWENTEPPKDTGPFAKGVHDFRWPGWSGTQGLL